MPSAKPHRDEIERLNSCSERFKPLAWQLYELVNKACALELCEPCVWFGYRSAQVQLEIWSRDRVLKYPTADLWDPRSWDLKDPSKKPATYAFPGESAHNYGDAVDIALIEGEGAKRHWIADKGTPGDRWHRIIGAAADKLGLAWGGRFPTFDGAHVQHPAWRLSKKK